MTQADLAKKLNVVYQTISWYETGKAKDIPLEKIQIMADLFDVTPGYILGIDIPEHSELSTEHAVLNAMYDECDKEARKNVLDYTEYQLHLSRQRTETDNK